MLYKHISWHTGIPWKIFSAIPCEAQFHYFYKHNLKPGRPSGRMVNMLDSGSSSLCSSPHWGHFVVFRL